MAEPSNKLQEQAAKGYSYFMSGHETANSGTTPKKLTPEEARALEEQQQAQRQASGATASVWNSAGTFEEKDQSAWARERVKELLPGTGSGGASISGVDSVTGDAHIWFVRGKKRAGFDLHITLSWESGGHKGTITLPSASPDDLEDLHLEAALMSDRGADGAPAALAAAKGLKTALTERLEAFFEELKQK